VNSTHTLSVLVENRPGVLARVAGLFARRGFNIDSLAVGETEDPAVSRMTVVVTVEGKPLEQMIKQLHKLINVIRVVELPHDESVERELALFKVRVNPGARAEVLEISEIFRAKVVDVDQESLIIEATGAPDKVRALEELLHDYEVVELARTGRIALARGSLGLKPPAFRPVPVQNQAADSRDELRKETA
jgi:acetolactate synthase I/III small subunit